MKRALLILAFVAIALGQKSATPTASAQYFDNAGEPCSGCKLYTYIAGSTTFQSTFTTATGGAGNTNPVVLDTAGRASVWTTPGQSYHFVFCTAAGGVSTCTPNGVALWDVDNVPGGSLVGTSTVTANYVYAGPSTGAAATPGFRALLPADVPAIAATTCSNQVVNAISTASVGTCHTVAGADFGASVAARAHLGTGSAIAAPGMSTTVDALAFQVAEIPAFAWVTTDFTTSGVGTALETITGLTWTIPVSTAVNMPFVCQITYSQAVANDVVAFGIQDVTVSPTNIAGRAIIHTSTTASTAGNLPTLTTTTATAIASATPGATATNYVAEVSGFIEAPSNASSSAIRILVSTATAADLVTIKRGSFCRLN
ncbi:MAG: hypothetical protein V4502_08090 [Pseudomonadota bacterium]